jgi:GntR family transcriptional regulator
MQAFTVLIAREAVFADALERERLRLSDRRRVLRLVRVTYEAGHAHSYQRVVYPLHRLPGLDRQLPSTGTLSDIAGRYGLTLGNARERISLVDAPSDVVACLAIGRDEKLVELDRITATADGAPIEWRVVFTRGSRSP